MLQCRIAAPPGFALDNVQCPARSLSGAAGKKGVGRGWEDATGPFLSMARRTSAYRTGTEVTMQREETIGTYQVEGDGRTVWVNDRYARCIARLGPAGMEVWTYGEPPSSIFEVKVAEAIETGRVNFDRFREVVMEHHGVNIPDRYRPDADRPTRLTC